MDFDFGEEPMLDIENIGDTSLYPFTSQLPSPRDTDNEDVHLENEEEDSFEAEEPQKCDTGSASKISACVTDAIRKKKNLLIECPPGLNRRMHILQSALEYFRWRKCLTTTKPCFEGDCLGAPDPSRIYLGVQNFSEMERVLKEIKAQFETSDHLKDIKMTILGPRKNLCINQAAFKSEAVVDGYCNQLLQNYYTNIQKGMQESRNGLDVCRFYPNSVSSDQLFSFTEDHVMFEGGLLIKDIEDLITHGNDYERCPFYDSRIMHSEADLIICPNEYLLSPVLRHDNGVKLQHSIVIIDDGYDIENRCLEQASLKFTNVDARKASSVLQRIVMDFQSMALQSQSGDISRSIKQFSSLVEPLRELSYYIVNTTREDLRPEKEEILEILSQLNIISSTELCDALDEMITKPGITIQDYDIIPKLKQFFTILCIAQQSPDDYRMFIRKDAPTITVPTPTLFIICANSSVLFGHLKSPTLSLILSGDCLAPMKCFEKSLGVKFHETLQVTHSPSEIYPVKKRYFLGYCCRGPTDTELMLDYDLRGKLEIRLEVCRAILELCKVIPNGVVILVHSPRYARMLWSTLQSNETGDGQDSFLAQIGSTKHIINLLIAPTEVAEKELIKYKQLCTGTGKGPQNGAVLFVLARGPLWKSCYLEGQEMRGVIHVSLPFGSVHKEPILRAREAYLEGEAALSKADPEETFLEWYRCEAFRILNQSFGRCVRSDTDWGIVVVLDSRMHAKRHEFKETFLPGWVSNLGLLRRYKFNELTDRIQQFVLTHQ